MKVLSFLFALMTLVSVTACGTDYKEKHEEIDKQEAQERLDDAESVNMDGDNINIEDD